MSRLAALLALTVVLSIAVGPGLALGADTGSIRGEPDLSVSAPAPTLAPGQATELTLQVRNDGDLQWGGPDQRAAVLTARDVTVEATADDAPFDIESEVFALGSVSEERPREVQVAVTVPEDAEPGAYDLEVELDYSHVAQYWSSNTTQYSQDHSHTVEETIEVTVEETARFELTNVTTDAQVGADGTLTGTLTNVGSEQATDTRLALESTSPGASFVSGTGAETYVGTLDPGASKTVTYDLTVNPETTVREYAVDGTVRYTDSDGLVRADPDLSAGFSPVPEQSFSVVNATGDLQAGDERSYVVEIRNDGPRTVREPVVKLDFENPNVYLDSPQQAVEALKPGETATVSYAVDVSDSVSESHQGVTLNVAYTDVRGDRQGSDPMPATATIAAERDQFEVTVQNATVEAGSTETVEVTVHNAGDRPVSEIEAKAYLDPPLDSTDDEAMIPHLEPGESETISYAVSAADSAPAKTFGLATDFQYLTQDGDTELSRTHVVGVTVTAAPDGNLPDWLLGGLAGLGVILVGAVWQRNWLAAQFR
ncbi:COG1361 S-layer family protein [Halodesulfurarchaeum sp. HSR-GB]|uniref:COG1361 S-layer family protein n=1 Tax=Halodesulfurarchaeum sp. HSR-GB TaxID=3074077 RepID=UPI00285CB0D9|nr:COG1361 S-layer family protein [Halodesulfurarchaeum sp. HSR-GB]MDR5656443.1 COG1361 S-layer family protein [Halodesulfurarchaeum sp. HSR-GB]